MNAREGNLQAPTRHALDWRNPEFYDEAALEREMERVFDICHGCRRCVSLCQSFPTLFDLVDESKTMEVDGVAKADYPKVVEQCYLCDLCYMTKCPYVPPHEWNVDFPHLMLRAKAVRLPEEIRRTVSRSAAHQHRPRRPPADDPVGRADGQQGRTRCSARGRRWTRFCGVAAGAQAAAVRRRAIPGDGRASSVLAVRDGARTPGKVAVFSTCY